MNVNVMLSNMTFLIIFAVLLSTLCNVILCNYKIYLSSFSILKIPALRHLRMSKVNKIELYVRLLGLMCIIVPNFIKIGQKVAEIWRINGFRNDGRPTSIILKFFKQSKWRRNLFCIVVLNL